MELQDLTRSNVTTIAANASLKEAVRRMYKDNVGSIIVVDTTNRNQVLPVGILTDRDIALALGTNPVLDNNRLVKDIMTKNLIMCSIHDDLYETVKIMKDNRIRRIPVVDIDLKVMNLG